MTHSISEVSGFSGVSCRALRHYHAIGLLVPASISPHGYRRYEHDQLLRLQRILLLRRSGMGLQQIGEHLAGAGNQVEALQDHRRRLGEEHERTALVIRTVDKALAELRGGPQLAPSDIFEGLCGSREVPDPQATGLEDEDKATE